MVTRVRGMHMTKSPLWCSEFDHCISEVLEPGAKKYAARDWEQLPSPSSVTHPRNTDAMFHHLSREYVFQENRLLIEFLFDAIDEIVEDPEEIDNFCKTVRELLIRLKFDEMGTRNQQYIATRACMSYTIEVRANGGEDE